MTRGRSKETLALEESIEEVVYDRTPVTVRGIAYGLFAAGMIPSMDDPLTRKVSRIVTAMREREDLDWTLIVDNGRQVDKIASWSNPESIIDSAVRQYRKNYWEDQDYHIEVWSEKGTVGGVLGPVLDDLGVTFRVMKGFGSFTSVRQAAEDTHASYDKEFVALYLGDHDPSGLHMSEVDLPARLERYGAAGSFERIAVLEEDHHLPYFSAATKKKDPRYKWFKQNYSSDKCWELDAIHTKDLQRRVRTAIESYIDFEPWDRCKKVEEVEMQSMRDFQSQWVAK